MRKIIAVAFALLMGFTATQAVAEEGRGKIGIGSYVLLIGSSGAPTDTFSGSALVAGYDFSDLLSVNGHLYSMSLDGASHIKMDGMDAMIRAGKNDLGFTYFGALGFYSETMSSTILPGSFDYSGGLFGFGIGYNWDSVSLDYEASIRSTSDYQGTSPNSVVATTGSLNIAYRF